jgi:hypothetical protein
MGLFSKDFYNIATGPFPTSRDHPPLPACLFFDTDGVWDFLQFIIRPSVADFIVDLIFGDCNYRISVVQGIG